MANGTYEVTLLHVRTGAAERKRLQPVAPGLENSSSADIFSPARLSGFRFMWGESAEAGFVKRSGINGRSAMIFVGFLVVQLVELQRRRSVQMGKSTAAPPILGIGISP